MKLKSISLTLIITSFSFFSLFAQKKFSASLVFPPQLNLAKVTIYFKNGLSTKKITPNTPRFLITDSFFAKYATIIVDTKDNVCDLPSFNIFFVSDKPATIKFNCNSSSKNKYSLPQYDLSNAYCADSIESEFRAYTANAEKQLNDFTNFLIKRKGPVDSAIAARNKTIVRNLINRDLSFIRQHNQSYFAFSIFRDFIAPNAFGDPVKLSNFYHSIFPADFKNTLEGKKIEETLVGRMLQNSDDFQAPNFKSKDIFGHLVSLADEKGKFVLFNIWATWCGPCIAEIPAIKKIHQRYPSSKLAIISVSCDHDSLAFIKAVKKYKMNWIQIYNDEKLINLFGGASSVPQLFLINPNDQIIYNRNADNKSDSPNLEILNSVLKKDL